ncbi:dienelactone hydrolase family protein [bacterium]|nr:dienelactone hydrolase family protein [bacterium]
MKTGDPHSGQTVLRAGPPPQEARGAIVFLHGRGGSAQGILSLYAKLHLPEYAALAPQAAGSTWYPHPFLAPLEHNEPYLGSALRRVGSLVDELVAQGMGAEHVALLGFSQGACLALEFIARHPRRYGAAIAFTGGLIGPAGMPFEYPGSLAGTPVFLGSGDPDPHVPFQRVLETKGVLESMGAAVELRQYPGMPHAFNEDEIEAARALLASIENGV